MFFRRFAVNVYAFGIYVVRRAINSLRPPRLRRAPLARPAA